MAVEDWSRCKLLTLWLVSQIGAAVTWWIAVAVYGSGHHWIGFAIGLGSLWVFWPIFFANWRWLTSRQHRGLIHPMKPVLFALSILVVALWLVLLIFWLSPTAH